jgi:hypothetical protein
MVAKIGTVKPMAVASASGRRTMARKFSPWRRGPSAIADMRADAAGAERGEARAGERPAGRAQGRADLR